MRIAYQYKLRPTQSQIALMDTWLDLLRLQYNYRLCERLDWWEFNRCSVNACPVVCSIAPLKEQPEYYGQKRDLLKTKELFPEYQDIYSAVLQDCIGRVKKTFERFLKGDSKGKRSGRPRLKQRSRYRSFTYPQMKADCLQGKFIALPKIGAVKLILHRPIPEGFVIKTATITKKADGYYITLSLQDNTVPTISPNINLGKVVGIDVGLNDFLVTSTGESVPIPQFARKTEKRRKVLNKALSRKLRQGTKRRQKAGIRLSKHYQKVARQRRDFHFKTAKRLLDKYDVVAHEDLNIAGLAKTRLSKSILDAGWASFMGILTVNVSTPLDVEAERSRSFKAESAGLLTIPVNPSGTTQDCSGCGVKVPKTLKERWHVCDCGLSLSRDENAAINIKQRAEGHPVFKAQRLLSDSRIG